MPARQRLGAADVGRVLLPDLARGRLAVAADAAGRAPQNERRARDLLARLEVLGVHLEIDPGAGAVILADGADGFRIAEAALVFLQRLLAEEPQALLGLGELVLDEPVRIGAHQLLGHRRRLDVEEPVPGKRRPVLVDVVEQMMLRDDVEDRRALHAIRMIETHAVRHARAAVVTRHHECLEAELLHHLDLVLRHGAERIVLMVLGARRLGAVAIAAQIGRDHGELLAPAAARTCARTDA